MGDTKSLIQLFLKFQVLKSMHIDTELAQWVPSKMDDQIPKLKLVIMKEQNREDPSSFWREKNQVKAREPKRLWSSQQHSWDQECKHGSNAFKILKKNGAIFLAQRNINKCLLNCNKLPTWFLICVLFPTPLEGCYIDQISQCEHPCLFLSA